MIRRRLLLIPHRTPAKFSTSSSSKPSPTSHSQFPPSSIITPSFSQPVRKRNIPTFLLLSAGTLLSACVVYTVTEDGGVSTGFRQNAERMMDSFKRVTGSMKQTGAAAAVLWKSLASVLSSANHEVKRGFEIRVAALVADIVAANEGRRRAIVEAGNGAVVDWLLDTVGEKSAVEGVATQAEAARALAFLIGDVDVRKKVLGRPGAVPNLLRFIFSFQPKKALKHMRGPLDGIDISKGRSMLVAAIMDVVTSNCDDVDKASFHPSLPPNADIRDIAAAIEVIEEGGMHFDEERENDDGEDGDIGLKGIGIKVIGGTTILGFSREENLLRNKYLKDDCLIEIRKNIPRDVSWQKGYAGSSKLHHFTSFSAPGLWDDLQREHIAVPFAAWALANWALASEINRSHIHELDSDGYAILTALTASERTVKWHGSMVARVLLEDQNLPLTNYVPDWCFSLLSTVSQSSKNDDMSLAWAALSAFIASIKRCDDAKLTVVEKGLHLMIETAKATEKHTNMQEALARALELLYASEMHLPLEESQKWAGILLRWIFNQFSTNSTRSSAIQIISSILEDHGPASLPLSQGWLTILLNEILERRKLKGAPEKTNEVQNQIHQSNALMATQTVNLLATAVVNLARNQVPYELDSVAKSPLMDFLSLEPFSVINKNISKDKLHKFDAADSAISTLKGIKALSDLCIEDSSCQAKIVDLGVLFLLRRLLLADDYEKLAANETYDASRVLDPQEKKSTSNGFANDTNDSSSVRIPPTAHIRRHAARLLMILSSLPMVAKVIVADQTLCAWLEDCSSGTIPCSNDLKVRSYAKATLLNAYCTDKMDRNCKDTGSQNNECPRYGDMLFLINPELQHWKCCKSGMDSADDSKPGAENDSISPHSNMHTTRDDSSSDSIVFSEIIQMSENPPIDVVFVHGLRGGAFKSWRIADDKSSTTSKAGLIENIDQEAGKKGTCWPREWLATDFPEARLFTVKYKTNLSQWTGASLPLQEVSSMMLQKLIDAGIGDRPVVFVTHSMGGLVVKQMLYQAKMQNVDKFVSNTVGIVFYSCPHFGSKLADMPMRMGLVLRPAPSIRELRSGSPRLMELNEFLRKRYNNGVLKILSFSETQVTPIVEGYGGWAFRMEIVPIESAYPGFGDIIVLDATDHINSCKPVSRTDPSYAKTLEFLQKLKANMT